MGGQVFVFFLDDGEGWSTLPMHLYMQYLFVCLPRLSAASLEAQAVCWLWDGDGKLPLLGVLGPKV